MADDLISVVDAASKGIERIRMPQWICPFDHIKLYIIDGSPGAWFEFWSPTNEKINDLDPIMVFITDMGDLYEKQFMVYTGALGGSAAYNAEVGFYNTVGVPEGR
jgi:hypothetical protein